MSSGGLPSTCSFKMSTRPSTDSSSFSLRNSAQSRHWSNTSFAPALKFSRILWAHLWIVASRCAKVTLSASSACCRSTYNGDVGSGGSSRLSSLAAPFASALGAAFALPLAFGAAAASAGASFSATAGGAYSSKRHTAPLAWETRSCRNGNSQRAAVVSPVSSFVLDGTYLRFLAFGSSFSSGSSAAALPLAFALPFTLISPPPMSSSLSCSP
mmetsp:Transcript_61920/g.189081  ORF Transcript_61920/g.189081 Transcript_61920/m.189081 type:complete len:213 (-) Transcript_61920:2042-2680(-)